MLGTIRINTWYQLYGIDLVPALRDLVLTNAQYECLVPSEAILGTSFTGSTWCQLYGTWFSQMLSMNAWYHQNQYLVPALRDRLGASFTGLGSHKCSV